MKSQKEIDAEINSMNDRDKKTVKAYEGIPTGAAVALHKELQELKKSNVDLKDYIGRSLDNILILLGEVKSELKNHEDKIFALECKDEEIDNHIEQIENKIQVITGKLGIAI